jgi:hypothetical protein
MMIRRGPDMVSLLSSRVRNRFQPTRPDRVFLTIGLLLIAAGTAVAVAGR